MPKSLGRFAAAILCALLFSAAADACTVFFLPTASGPLFARNFDFPAGGAYLARNGRGVTKASLLPPPLTSLRWRSRYGSVTVNQAGFEFPTEGMNEAGLAIAALVWDGGGVPKSALKPAINQLQWIQYQLDTQATVRDVLATLSEVPVVEMALPLHFAVCDGNECAVVEWVDGKPVAYVGADLPVPALANDGYASSCRLARGEGSGAKSAMDVLLGSGDRFVGAARAVETARTLAPTGLVPHAFAGLDRVAQGPFTQWQTVLDPRGRTFELRRGNRRPKARVALESLDFADGRPGWVDLDKAAAKGEVADRDFAHALPAHYCRDVIASLGSVRESVDPRLLAAIPGYVHGLHPSSRPAPLAH